jgi:hypothetical protein
MLILYISRVILQQLCINLLTSEISHRRFFMKKLQHIIIAIIFSTLVAACGHSTSDRALSGGAIGAGVGAVGGAVLGGNPVTGAVVGGAVGAAAGEHSGASA